MIGESDVNVWMAPTREPGANEAIAVAVERVIADAVNQLAATANPMLELAIPGEARLSLATPRTRKSLCGVCRVLNDAHRLMCSGQTATKREIYYQAPAAFEHSQKKSDKAIERAALLLRVPRHRLGICAAPRGFAAGPLLVHTADGGCIDCAATSLHGGWAIRGDFLWAVRKLSTTARLVVVVEKHTAFRRLVADESFWARCPRVVCITGRGYPGEATAALVRALCGAEGEGLGIPAVCIADFDPFGADIICCFERLRCFARPDQTPWIALRSQDALQLPPSALMPLTDADVQKARTLLCSALPPTVRVGLEAMLACGRKAELDAAPPHLIPDLVAGVYSQLEPV